MRTTPAHVGRGTGTQGDDVATISIIGTGNMGNAIGGVLTDGGSDVQYVSHAQMATAPLAGTVILAVPYPALEEIVAVRGDDLAGKTVVDITNPVDFETFDGLVVPPDGSAAAELQAALPSSAVLKAFNTTFAATLATKQVGGRTTTVLIAGDDDDAKAALASAVDAGGVLTMDAGRLARARELEALGFLQLTLAAGERIGWDAGFVLVP